jgi:hypothetical protein
MMRDCMPERYPLPRAEAVAAYVALFLRAIGVERFTTALRRGVSSEE